MDQEQKNRERSTSVDDVSEIRNRILERIRRDRTSAQDFETSVFKNKTVASSHSDEWIGRFCVDLETLCLRSVSREIQTRLEYDSETLNRMRPTDLSFRFDSNRNEEFWAETLARVSQGESAVFPWILLSKSGKIFPLRIELDPDPNFPELVQARCYETKGYEKGSEEKRKFELELTEKKATLSRFQKLSGLGSWEYDLSDSTMNVSEQLAEIYERKELTSRGIYAFDRIHPEDRERVISYFEEALINDYIREIEYRISTESGKTKVLLNQSELIRGENGKIVKIIGSVMDVSEKRKNERLLQFRLGFETIATEVSRNIINLPSSEIENTIRNGIEKSGRFLSMNRAVIAFYNEDCTERVIAYEWIHPDSEIKTSYLGRREPIDPMSFFTSVMKTGRIAKINSIDDLPRNAKSDREHLLRNGTQTYIAVPLLIGGKLKGRLGFGGSEKTSSKEKDLDRLENQLLENFAEIIINALERKRVEEELKQERDLFSSIMENTPTAVVVLNPEGKILYANPSSETILGIRPEEIVSRNYDSPEWKSASIDGEEWKEEDQPFTQVLKTGKPVYDIRHSITAENGEKRFLSVNGAPVKNQNGEIQSLAFMITDITNQVLKERDLRESEERYRTVAEQTGSIVYDYDLASGRIKWAGAIRSITGYDPEEFQNFTVDTCQGSIHPEDLPFVLSSLQTAMSRGERFRSTYRFRTKSGEYTFVEDRGAFLFDSNGKPNRILGAMIDVAEKKKAEEMLKASETRFQTFYQFSNEAILLLEKGKNRISDSNQAFQKLFGYTSEEAADLSILRLLSRDSLRDLLRKKFVFGGKTSVEVVAKKKNGNLFPSVVSHAVFFDKGREFFSINIIDTTPFKEAEKLRIVNNEILVRNRLIEIQKSELETTLENLKKTQSQLIQSEKMAALGQLMAGIAHEINNPIGAVQASSQNIQECLFRFRSLLPEVQTLMTSLGPEKRTLCADLIETAIASGENFTGMEQRNRKKTIASILENLRIPLKTAVSYADTLVDMGIGELPERFIPLLVLEQTPLILEYTSLESFFFRNTKTIRIAIDRISKILYALKNFSHFDIGGERTLASVKETIETVLTIYQNQLKKGVDLQKEFEDVPAVLCFPDDLLHIWTNLIYNSLQAMQFKGSILIRLKKLEKELMVEVRDNGPGIPKEIQERIFEPFFTTKAPGEGSGLGLDIVKKIVQKHEGKIELESEPGRTSFKIYIPIVLETRRSTL
ncbi:PAS domain S-box protein [Leptospira gomenensis]|uniref:histidine kinase n=1 Tax=Leptospira gomenensis TaxID=2484974 RepID=A0A5F1YBR1_9LEPT|nr:PAS domain S-box protein [Leptospira gomenensis]TGK34891.1 PAS domain S-box protein [Leptospira gomenensis]TGK41141.1 PAS domain S-box protein [Leptospira gomenensis]TGK42058.1 PAS domain S-box protein [Leptospira gomenensis]TGK56320.1 PAS domain S-box protein [Leptospira gomenensis]